MEVTNRTFQQRFLLLPTKELREIVLGILGRVQRKLDMPIHAFTFASNHFHLLVTPRDADHLARFMRRFEQKLSTEITRLFDWEGSIWQDRYHAIPIESDERALVGRLRYVLSHGVKEGLVRRCAEWPGANCVRALAEGQRLVGTWYDRSAQYRAGRWGREVDEEDFAHEEELVLTPLPCWAHYSEEDRRVLVREMLSEVEAQAAAAHATKGTSPIGVEAILAHHPWERPPKAKHATRPWVHAATRQGHLRIREAYRLFVASYRDAAELFKCGAADARFPEGSFPPAASFVPLLAPG